MKQREPKERVVVKEVERPRQDSTMIEEPERKPKSEFLVQLLVKNSQGFQSNYDIVSDSFNIGREDDNDLVLDQSDRSTSRYHARIRREGKGKAAKYIISDLDTPGGTMVNNKKVERAELNDGDLVIIGKTQMSFIKREVKVL